jgi:hypothetical protein
MRIMFIFYKIAREKVKRVPGLTSSKFFSLHAMNMETMQHNVPTGRDKG